MTAKKPGYREIAASIREEIASGRLAVGDMLPSLTELQADWNVSRVTARRAVKALEAEGWVSGRSGKNALVAQAVEVPCPPWAAEMWGIQPGDPIRAQLIDPSIILRRI